MEIKTSFVGYIYTSNWSAIFTFKIRKSITYFSCYWPFEKSPFFSSTNFFNNPVRITFNHSYFPHIFYSISQTRNPEWGKPIISHLRIVFEFFSFFFFWNVIQLSEWIKVRSHDAILHPIFSSDSISTKIVSCDHPSRKQSLKVDWKSEVRPISNPIQW